MDWLYYLLEANLYLLVFYGFYRLFLYNETFYNSNRYYLLFTSLLAFIIPVLQLGFLKPVPTDHNVAFPPPVLYTKAQLAEMAARSSQGNFDFTGYLYPIYLIIALGFAIKLGFAIFKIIKLWLKATKKNTGAFTLIELEHEASAFSFFNLLFINPNLAQKQTVVAHEMVHIKQKHSLDVLFFELLQIICWFNPIIPLLKKDIQLLHEYIADEQTANTSMQKHEYAMFLIENSFGIVPISLTNQIFNQSILKRRINMLNKKRTANWARLRLLLALPLAIAMLGTSTLAFAKDYGYVDLLPEKSSLQETIQEVPKVENIKKQQNPKVKNIKRAQVKFPPPIVYKDRFYVAFRNVNGKAVPQEKRHIVINGQPIADMTTFYGVNNAENIEFLTSERAIKKYGNKGKNGAVEITGANIKYYEKVALPPPHVKTVKFPPPIIKADSKKLTEVTVVGHEIQQTNMVKVEGHPIQKNEIIIVEGHPINKNKTDANSNQTNKIETITVQGYPMNKNGNDSQNNKVKAITIKGQPIDKKNEVITVQGFKIEPKKKEGEPL